MGQPASPDDPEATERQLEDFIARFTPEIADRARACRAKLRAFLPTATELVYDNYNALAIGYAPAERTSEAIVSLAVYPRNVTLFFLQGACLPDPDAMLSGEGNQVRSIRLPTPATLDDPKVQAMLATALAYAARPLPAEGCGRTVVKSISARQRPRRPLAKEPA